MRLRSNYGYEAKARQAKERFLAIVSQGRESAENYPTQWRLLGNPGMPHYNFGTGTLIHFILDWHLRPVLP